MVGLGDLPGGDFLSDAKDVSADGSVIVGAGWSASGPEAFRWVDGGGMSSLGDLPGGRFSSQANGVSADGSIVVGTTDVTSGSEAFRWTVSDGMVGMGFPPFVTGGSDFFSTGLGVSADGLVVVGGGNDVSTNGGLAYRWTEATGMVTLGILPNDAHSPSSVAFATSADGSVVVGASTSDTGGPPGNEAFRWTENEGMVGLGFILDMTYGAPSTATAVSADGSVVVGYSDFSAGDQAFLWTAGDGIRLLRDILAADLGLDLTGWTLESATGISDDGLTIVGTGINPNGDTEAFIATLPEPGALTVMVLGVPALLRRRSKVWTGRSCKG